MNITCKVDITPEQISDQFVTAFEGGSNYWLRGHDLISPDRKTLTDSIWYADHKLYDGEFVIRLAYDDPEKDDEGAGSGRKNINQFDVERGLNIMADKCPHQFGLLRGEDGDAITADVFLQCVLFGDVVYG